MGHEFDRDIEIERVAEGEYAAELAPGWVVGGGLNGGYLLAVIANALRASAPGKPDPFAVSAHYLSASTPGAATISTRMIRNGGSVATLGAELVQDGTPRITALATYGDLSALSDDVSTSATELELPALDDCLPTSMAPESLRKTAPLLSRFDLRLDPAHAGWAMGSPSGKGVVQGWIRLADGREPDALSLLQVLDALPPAPFDLGKPGWAPTLELTAHVRAVPAPGWLKVRHATRNVAGGMFEEDCEIWDSAGRLVAQSRQLARMPRD